MNPKFLNDKYFEKFIKDRAHKIHSATRICKDIAVKNPEFDLNKLDLNRILKIRSLIPSYVFPDAIINAVRINPKRRLKTIFKDVVDYLINNRALMAGSCHDCLTNIYLTDEYSFILKKQIWKKAAKDKTNQFFCIGCLETRLKRKLKSKDFDWGIPLNNIPDVRSDRLLERMYGVC